MVTFNGKLLNKKIVEANRAPNYFSKDLKKFVRSIS
jgi:hypothetical protein